MALTSKAVARLKTAAQVSKELMLEAAILATKDGLSQHAAAKQFGVPRSTMRDRMVNPEPKAKGSPAKLPVWAEKELVDMLVSCADMGVLLNRFHSLQVISEMAAELDQGFLERPGQVWNLDETAFDTVRLCDRIIARKGVRQIASQYDGIEKKLVTILPCGNAAGLQLRFMALFSGKLHVQSRLDDTHNLCYQAVNAS
ncbi:hypothetical protein RvY_02485 [Ramazzottius varieornatus]|uniref:HTH psq-type domain-containing protein n=1 Tax=Ramazzottius varieornatus TaxID=947166 RepID=A0A1D1UUE2_RAMVA|nr:hypothetical protein RvY_02485 [Ramazzottius varieornatus]